MVSVVSLPLESVMDSSVVLPSDGSPPISLPEYFGLTATTSDGMILTLACDSLNLWRLLQDYVSKYPENCVAFVEMDKPCGKMSKTLKQLCMRSGVEVLSVSTLKN